VLAWLLAAVAPESTAAAPPEWLVQAGGRPSPPAASDAPAVVLLSDREVTVSGRGVLSTRDRRAVRCLKASGAVYAAAVVSYLTDTERVSDFRGILLRADGTVVTLGKDEIVDAAASPQDAFNESRVQVLDASRQARPGDVFGVEWTKKGPALLSQLDWPFQDRLPTLASRLSVLLPEGWSVTAASVEGSAPRETKDGTRTTWVLEDLPYIPDEPLAPHLSTLAPRIAVSWRRPAGDTDAPGSGSGLSFQSWDEVSRFLSELSEQQAELGPAVRARALELTAGSSTDLARVEDLCRNTQKLSYVSVQLGMGRGGGYRPHTAADVLLKGHGDCKDKATLLRSLLRAVGIRSWAVVLYSGDSSFVRKDWPSPQQFDHMILGIELKEIPAGAPTVTEPGRPPLLLFDPTSETVPFGDLPASDRFGYGLVVRPEGGTLVRMPGAPPGGFRELRAVKGGIQEDGSIAVRFEWQADGPMADVLRSLTLSLSRNDFARALEDLLSGSVNGIRVANSRLTEKAAGRAGLETDLTGQTHARALPGGLLLFRPAIVSWNPLPVLPPGPRILPIVLVPKTVEATYDLLLPPRNAIDEIPEPVNLVTPYGKVVSELFEQEKRLVLRQKLTLGGDGGDSVKVVPAAEYEAVRAFFSAVRDALNPAVVLRRP
jgi:hypothetical protein